MKNDSEILIAESEIKKRIAELADALRAYCAGDDLMIVWLKDGAAMFVEEFCKHIGCGVKTLGVKASSYGHGKTSSGKVEISDEIFGVSARRILLMDDILDSGETARAVCLKLRELGAEEIKTCFLFSKKNTKGCVFEPDYVGFEIQDLFVYGFGLDLECRLRELSDLYYIKE